MRMTYSRVECLVVYTQVTCTIACTNESSSGCDALRNILDVTVSGVCGSEEVEFGKEVADVVGLAESVSCG